MSVRLLRLVTAAVALPLAWAAAAMAQPASPGLRHRVEVSAGGLWLGGAALGSETATLRANRTPAAPFTLFTTDTRAASAPGFDVRLGFWLARSLAVEAGLVRARPELRTMIAGDIEGAPSLTVSERLDQYFIDASVVWLVEPLRFRERTVPFVSGGGGYLRQLHEGRTLVETGQVYHVGGGIRHLLRRRSTGAIRTLGLRLDGRAYVLVDGVRIEEGPRTHGAISGSLFLSF